MGLLEDAIREHLDLKRSRGADPSEIERLEREALGPVRREPVAGTDRFEPVGVGPDPSPIEYHDSTAPHWQQEEDLGEHHSDAAGFEASEPETSKRRRFLRRSRGGGAADREPVPEPEAALGWPDYDDAGTDFVDEHFGPAYGVPQEDHFDETGFEQTGSLSGGPDVDVGSSHPLYEPPPEPEAAASGLDAHPQAGGRFEPNHGPPTEVYRPLDEPSVEADVKPVPAPHEVERTEPPASASAVGAHHPILDDLPFHQPATEAPVDQAPAEARISPSESSAAAAALTAEPEPESASPPETATAPAQPEGPPQLQFDRPPQRPTFTAEPPRMGDSDEARPKPPSRAKPRREDEMQGTLEFDVAGDLGEEGAEEDVLEVTPDFLQDTPEHDRLWFEQRPPKDFDFDG